MKIPGSSTAVIVQCDLEKISACAFNSAVVSGQRSFVPRAVIMNIPVQWLQEARSGGYQPQLLGGARKMFAAFMQLTGLVRLLRWLAFLMEGVRHCQRRRATIVVRLIRALFHFLLSSADSHNVHSKHWEHCGSISSLYSNDRWLVVQHRLSHMAAKRYRSRDMPHYPRRCG